MGYKSSSTRRTSAASAVSSQSVVVNTATGFAAVGSAIKSTTAISLGVTTVGQTSSASKTTVSAGPVIGNVQYLDANNAVLSDDIAVSTAGGNVLINGTGFAANSNIYVNNTLVSNTFISSTQIRAELPAASVGNVTLMIFTPTNVGTISPNAIRYSGFPSWTSAAVSLQNNIAANVALVVSGDSTLTYSLQDGSSLPTGISLNSAGYLTGTATGYSSSTSMSAVIVATDLEGQATQQTINFTITAGDDRFAYTTLLLNGETSVTPFHADASSNSFGLTLAGDVRADRFSPYYGNGYYSNYFDGSGDYLTLPSNQAAFTMGTGDFTVEMWVNISSLAAGRTLYDTMNGGDPGGTGRFAMQVTTGGVVQIFTTAGTILTSGGTLYAGVWYHVAYSKASGTGRLYVNGVQVNTSYTDNNNYVVGSTSRPIIGINAYDSSSSPMMGYISNLRVTKGTAVYTTNFTPSTVPLAAISGTSLLTCQSNRFLDKSSNNYLVTKTGDVSISPAVPFAPSDTYAAYGSMYVPTAVTNYLALAHTAATTITSGSTDSFSAECWVYFNSATATTCIIDQSGQNTVTFQNWSLNLDSAKKFQIIWGGTGSPGSQIGYISGTTVAASGVWYHLAYVKTGVNWSLFVNGAREATYSGLNTASDGTQNPLRIGSDTFSSQSINGYIADVRVYKGATAVAPYDAASSTITIPTAPLTAVTNTQLLTCQYNGGANNSGIIDVSNFNNVITRFGNVSQGTFSPYSQTGWSLNFNRSRVDSTLTGKSPGTGSFTYELFFNVTVKDAAIANVAALFSTRGGGTGADGFDVQITTAGAVQISTSGVTLFTSSSGLVTNGLWYHLAIVRNGSTNWTIYLNGSSIGTISNSTNFTSTNLYLGVFGGASQDWFKGYISNFRYTRDAVYTSTFTPSVTPLTVIANTEFLSCQMNRYLDVSANNFAVTPVAVNGSSSIQAFSPFSPSAAYTPSLHGGSAYFDGTGDAIQTANYSTELSPGTRDFTIEFWVYATAGSRQDWVNLQAASGFNRILIYYTGTAIRYDGGSSSAASARITYTTASSTFINGWHHIALSRAAGSSKLFLDGVQIGSTFVDTLDWTNPMQLTTMRDPNGSTYASGYISDLRIIKGSGVYTANFTPPTSPLTSPLATPASLLLSMTNGGITDKHSSNILETIGNAQLSTAVKKYGSASVYFPNTASNALQFPASSQATAFGTGDFTVECWVNFTSSNSTYNPFVRYDGSGTFDFGYDFSATQLKYSGSAAIFAVTQTFTPGTWYHVAVTRASGSSRLFVNGTQIGTTVTGDANNYAAGAFKVGGSSFSAGHIMNGYINDLRITRGFARYTANFTPPTTAMLGQ